MTDKKDFKIEFAPGCFDHFDGTQEELDQMIADIQSIFKGKSGEEIEAMSVPLNEDTFEELDDELKDQILQTLRKEFGDDEPKRRLQ